MGFIRAFNKWLKMATAAAGLKLAWSSLQVNHDAIAAWHKDLYNESPFIIAALGKYVRGLFQLDGQEPLDIKGKWVFLRR